MSVVFYLRLDSAGVVIGTLRSPEPQPDSVIEEQNLVAVDQPTFEAGSLRAGLCQLVEGALRDCVPPPAPAPYSDAEPYLTGRDVVDGLSPQQAKAANAEDPRNLARISAARTAAEVKSCVARVARANGIDASALLAQATPTGGT